MKYYQVWTSNGGLEGAITQRNKYDVLFTFSKGMDGCWRLKENGSDKCILLFPARETYTCKENYARFQAALQDFFASKESEGGYLYF